MFQLLLRMFSELSISTTYTDPDHEEEIFSESEDDVPPLPAIPEV